MSISRFSLANDLILGGDKPVLIAGPCAIESYEVVSTVVQTLKTLCFEQDTPFVFKASYDKANRTSHKSFRSIGFEAALEILSAVRTEFKIPILTDVHETTQVEAVAQAVDILQIPAFLCRQTDLLQEAGRTGLPINIKRGQFMAAEDMAYAVEKIVAVENSRVFLTERGYSFGYHNLVVDMRALPIMRQFTPVIFDVTHSIQMPGGQGGSSGGQREFAAYLARAAAAVGVDGFFIETHPNPSKALSDSANMIPLDEMPAFLESILAVWNASRPYVKRLSQ